MRIKLKRGQPVDAAKVADTVRPVIRYAARLPDGSLLMRMKEWKRPSTKQAILEWMLEYAERVEAGYKPAGFEVAPLPFYARVMKGAQLLAEWRRQ